MASHKEITESLRVFEENYKGNKRLKIMNKDWDRIIHVKATDVSSDHTLKVEEGELSISEGAPKSAHLTVLSDSSTLADLFFGDITPTEPYLNGTLKVFGSEEDIIRLDIISLLIWGE